VQTHPYLEKRKPTYRKAIVVKRAGKIDRYSIWLMKDNDHHTGSCQSPLAAQFEPNPNLSVKQAEGIRIESKRIK